MAEQKRKWGIGPIDAFIRRTRLDAAFRALGPDPVCTVYLEGRAYRFFIPHAMQDKMQLVPLMGRFHELSYLVRFRKLIGPDPGVMLDLGANYGSHTLFFAAEMGATHVHAFEPQARLKPVLERLVALNGLDNVTIHPVAAGAKTGHVRLVEENAENSGMTTYKPDPEQRDGGHVPMVAVDDVVDPDEMVSGVKIDVEGMQMPVLRGMSRLIRRWHPVLWLELRPKRGELEQPTDWLAGRGYQRIKVGLRDFFFAHESHPALNKG